MAQFGESISVDMIIIDEDKCDYKPEKHKWKAILDGNSTKLEGNLGNKPNASCEAELSKTAWPSQAHHLIPHLTLKKHPVSKWIKEGEFLYADTDYDVDHKRNGLWMPYASSLQEWTVGATKKADREKNRDLKFKVMRLSNMQLHQGKHSGSNRYGIGESAYKERVKEYLEKIKNHAVSHYAGDRPCKDCSGKKQADKYPPTENMVRYVDRASYYLEDDIQNCRIFVSRVAAEFADIEGFELP